MPLLSPSCPARPPLFAGLTAMDDSWDERMLALEVSRLSRAARARISRAKQREAAEMTSCSSSCRHQGQQKRAKPKSESTSLTLSKDCASSQARKRPNAAATKAATAAQSSNNGSGRRSRPTTSLRHSFRSPKGDSGKLAACAWDKVRLVASAGPMLTVGTECSGQESVMAASKWAWATRQGCGSFARRARQLVS